MQYNLPDLIDVDVIEGLTQSQLDTYIARYSIPNVGNLSREIKLLRLMVFVGCTVDSDAEWLQL
jgi:hypothetical protein